MSATAIDKLKKHKSKDAEESRENKEEKKKRKKRKLDHDTSVDNAGLEHERMDIHYTNHNISPSHTQDNESRMSIDTEDTPTNGIAPSTPTRKKLGTPKPSTTSMSKSTLNTTLSHLPLSSPYTLITASRYFPLSPAYSHNPKLGIQNDHLDPLIFKYDATLQGVVLLHQNLRFKSTTARISNDSPFAFAWADVDFMLWKPMPGMVLEGWVNNASPSHVGLLFANVFSVSVPREGIPNDWVWVEDSGQESHLSYASGEKKAEQYSTVLGYWKNKQSEVVKDIIRFMVVQVKADGGMLSLEGSFLLLKNETSLVDEGSIVEGIDDVEIVSDEEEARRRKEKKEKKREKKKRKEDAL